MKTEIVFELSREYPALSDAEIILLAYIIWRTEGTRLVDSDGRKYIILAGRNDPMNKECGLGWTESKAKRVRAMLLDKKLIKAVRQFNDKSRIYLTLSEGSTVGSKMRQLKNETTEKSVVSKTSRQSSQIRADSRLKNKPTALYIERPTERPRERPSSRSPEFYKLSQKEQLDILYQEALEEEARNEQSTNN